MVQTTACPAQAQWERLLRGELSEGEAEPLEQHLLACDVCFQAVRAARADDPLAEALRGCSPAGTPLPGAVLTLIQRLKAWQVPGGGAAGARDTTSSGPWPAPS